MYVLQIEEEGAANLGHEALADVAPEKLYNIFCAGCQGVFLRRDFFRGDFFGLACPGDFFGRIFLGRIQKGVGTPAQPD